MTYRRVAIFAFGLALAIAASVPLFVAIQNSKIYISAARGQFYTPLQNSPTGFSGFLQRATSKENVMLLLRFSLWPFLIFLILQCPAGYSISRAILVEGEFATSHRLRAGFLISLGVTALCLAVVWVYFLRIEPR